jgi:hypothetical protein
MQHTPLDLAIKRLRDWLRAIGVAAPLPERVVIHEFGRGAVSSADYSPRFDVLMDGRHGWVSLTAEGNFEGALQLRVHYSRLPVGDAKRPEVTLMANHRFLRAHGVNR